MNNQNYVATMFDAMFKILNTAQVYVSGRYMRQESVTLAFYEAFQQCQVELEKGPRNCSIEPEYFIEEFKVWAKRAEDVIFMSMMSRHPEDFYPQQIEDMPGDDDFWWGLYQKEQWDLYDHPFFDSWLQEAQDITQEMWQEH